MTDFRLPFSENDVRGLHLGESLRLSGRIYTARDAAHKRLAAQSERGEASLGWCGAVHGLAAEASLEHGEASLRGASRPAHPTGLTAKARPTDLAGCPYLPDVTGGVLYHCGPVIVREDDGWRVTAAGPTTSIREEPYMPEVIRKYGIRAIIGKGGMGEGTKRACQEYGCVYLHAVGGAAQVIAACIRKVTNVYMLEEFGAPEALWELEVEDFPVIVTMDCHGNSLHEQILQESSAKLKELLEVK